MEEAEIAVQNILKNLSKKEIRTSKQIKQTNYLIIEELFDDFMCYEKNVKNKEDAIKAVDGYELIKKKDIIKGDKILYFKTKHFFNIKPVIGSASSILPNGKLSLKVGSKYLHSDAQYYFKKLTDDDKLKISLIETVFDN